MWRNLLILACLISCGSTWLGMEIRRAARQQEAARAIEWLGGYVCLDYQSFTMLFCPPEGERPLPHFIYLLLGDHFCTHVDEVRFCIPVNSPCQIGNQLRCFPTLRRLTVNGYLLSSSLSELSCLHHLEELDLDNMPISDQGLDSLPSFESLRTLTLPANVDVARAEQLQARMPQCAISVHRGNVLATPKERRSESEGAHRIPQE